MTSQDFNCFLRNKLDFELFPMKKLDFSFYFGKTFCGITAAQTPSQTQQLLYLLIEALINNVTCSVVSLTNRSFPGNAEMCKANDAARHKVMHHLRFVELDLDRLLLGINFSELLHGRKVVDYFWFDYLLFLVSFLHDVMILKGRRRRSCKKKRISQSIERSPKRRSAGCGWKCGSRSWRRRPSCGLLGTFSASWRTGSRALQGSQSAFLLSRLQPAAEFASRECSSCKFVWCLSLRCTWGCRRSTSLTWAIRIALECLALDPMRSKHPPSQCRPTELAPLGKLFCHSSPAQCYRNAEESEGTIEKMGSYQLSAVNTYISTLSVDKISHCQHRASVLSLNGTIIFSDNMLLCVASHDTNGSRYRSRLKTPDKDRRCIEKVAKHEFLYRSLSMNFYGYSWEYGGQVMAQFSKINAF